MQGGAQSWQTSGLPWKAPTKFSLNLKDLGSNIDSLAEDFKVPVHLGAVTSCTVGAAGQWPTPAWSTPIDDQCISGQMQLKSSHAAVLSCTPEPQSSPLCEMLSHALSMSVKVLTCFKAFLRRLNRRQTRPSLVWAPSLEAPSCSCQRLTLFWRWRGSLQQATLPSEICSSPMTGSARRESSSNFLNVLCLLWALTLSCTADFMFA